MNLPYFRKHIKTDPIVIIHVVKHGKKQKGGDLYIPQYF
jgi:hypothetical protein